MDRIELTKEEEENFQMCIKIKVKLREINKRINNDYCLVKDDVVYYKKRADLERIKIYEKMLKEHISGYNKYMKIYNKRRYEKKKNR